LKVVLKTTIPGEDPLRVSKLGKEHPELGLAGKHTQVVLLALAVGGPHARHLSLLAVFAE
jgi:hypothetical protein